MTADPYATPPPLPYNPEEPETYPVEAVPAPELEHLTAQEAIARQEEAVAQVEAFVAAVPPGEPPMVTAYKAQMAADEAEPSQ